jgi:twitching motility protein PilT
MIEQILKEARSKNCSDVHISSSYRIIFRLDGDLIDYSDTRILEPQDVYNIIFSIINNEQKEFFLKNQEIDFSYQLSDKSR